VPAPRDLLREWLTNFETAPMLLVFPREEVRKALERRAEALGFKVGSTTTGAEALELVRSLRPVAILCDLNLEDMDGRELLARVRSDFRVRDTPFLVLSGEDLAQHLYELEGEAIDPVLLGLESALGPRVKLYGRLRTGDPTSVPGAVDPVGVTALLRTIGACRRSGTLLLKTGLKRNAELTLRKGVITAATVHRPISEAGLRAVVQMVGLEWKEFIFMPDEDRGGIPEGLGDLESILEHACSKNNEFLDRLYRHGIRQREVLLDEQAVEDYLHTLPTGSMEVLMRLKEGGPLGELVDLGVASAGLLRAMLLELRRRGAVRPTSVSTMTPVLSAHRAPMETASVATIDPDEGTPLPAYHRWLVPCLAAALMAAGFAITYLLLTR